VAEIFVLDRNFNAVAVVDTINSLIWTERYSAYGDFEIYTEANTTMLSFLQIGYFIWRQDSRMVMIIEEKAIESNVETGNFLIVRGRSLESILNWQIVWTTTLISGNLQSSIKSLINENLINPQNAARKQPITWRDSTDPIITALTLEKEVPQGNLYEAIKAILDEVHIGFRITLEESGMVIELYAGVDRSYAQDTTPYVIFSPEYDNILNSNYLEASTNERNVALVVGRTDSDTPVIVVVGDVTGFDRRELFVDAKDISPKREDGSIIPADEYEELLRQRGNDELREYKRLTTFEGEVEVIKTFVYKQDFFIGDIVQIINEYGIEGSARVSEMMMSEDTSGSMVVPTFIVDEE
jgi:hypothetical protein